MKVFLRLLPNLLAAFGIDHTMAEKGLTAIDLDPAAWNVATETKASKEGNLLRLDSAGTSTWASPAARWPVAANTRLARGGRGGRRQCRHPSRWFDHAGQLVSTAEAVRLGGGSIETRGASLQPPEGAAAFGPKFWIEGEPARASIAGVTLERQPDWVSGVRELHRVEPRAIPGKIWKPTAELLTVPTPRALVLRSREGHAPSRAFIWTPRSKAVRPSAFCYRSSCCLSPDPRSRCRFCAGTARGSFSAKPAHLKDLTKAGRCRIRRPRQRDRCGSPNPPSFAAKLWVTAPAGEAVQIGTHVYAEAETAP